MMLTKILLLSLLSTCFAATCPKCPANGIWSEWTVKNACATTCGSCSNVTKTRTCVSEVIGCGCVGNTTMVSPCNTQACNMPRTNTKDVNCCQGTLMIISNWYHCGPVELDYKLDCCPDGGYWSDWSSYSKIPAKVGWTRSRTCISGGHGCPCTGESAETVYSCPCKPIQLMKSTDNPCASHRILKDFEPFEVRGLVAKPSQCEMEFVLEATNFRGDFVLDEFTEDNGYKFATPVGVQSEAGDCVIQYYHVYSGSTDGPKDTGVSAKRVFTCNLETLMYEGHGQQKVQKIAQFYRNPTGRG